MNAKVAKRIRKELSYHPSMARTYKKGNIRKYGKKGDIQKVTATLELADSDPRALYQECKKEYYEGIRD